MKKIILLAAALLLSAQAQAANIVINGSFEDPDIATGTWTVLNSIPGWTTGGAGVEIRDNVAGTAYQGDQFAELDSHGNNSNSSISQILNTVVGQMYELTFAYSPRIRQSDATNGIDVSWNGALLSTVTAMGSSAHNWIVYSFMVEAVGHDTLKFAATGIEDTLGGSLDAIEVNAVPIPAAAFLFAPALLGFLGLRRKTKSTIA
ncbi:MAG: hypothetical protein ACI9QV_000162 [Methylophagaceae bacterium]|jgi:hypothetical protein